MSTPRLLNILLILSIGLMPAIGYGQDAKPKGKPTRAAVVGMDRVIEEITRQTVPVLGRLVTQQSGIISVLIKGVVEQVPVQVGKRVSQDDVLAILSTDRLNLAIELKQAEVQSATAGLAAAKAHAQLKSLELKRLNKLRESSVFSLVRFENATQEVAKAKSATAAAVANLTRARANLKLAQIDLSGAQVKAPYGGVISVLHTGVGTYLNTGQPVVTLVNDQAMEIEAHVPIGRLSGLTAGNTINFALHDKSSKTALVRAIIPEENPLTRTRKVRFTPSKGSLPENAGANQSVTLSIPTGPPRQAITVHKDAVLNKSGERMVFIVIKGKALLRTVTLGDAVAGRFIVLSGLKPGDQVVVRGNERLRPGQEVQEKGAKSEQGVKPK